jgi:hypothetical protein
MSPAVKALFEGVFALVWWFSRVAEGCYERRLATPHTSTKSKRTPVATNSRSLTTGWEVLMRSSCQVVAVGLWRLGSEKSDG